MLFLGFLNQILPYYIHIEMGSANISIIYNRPLYDSPKAHDNKIRPYNVYSPSTEYRKDAYLNRTRFINGA